MLYAGAPADSSTKVKALVEKLLNILDVRHREILSVEESITYNKSELERESLSNILKQKVRAFLKKEYQVNSVLEDLKESPDPSLVFLYKRSLDQLDEYKKNISQIQELYFRKPVVFTPQIETQSGNGQFGEFLQTWEKEVPVQSTEVKTVKAQVPSKDRRYFDHLKATHFQDNNPKFETFVDGVQEAAAVNQVREALPPKDRQPLDHYYRSLQEKKTMVARQYSKDSSFANFYTQLESNYQEQKGQRTVVTRNSSINQDAKAPSDYMQELENSSTPGTKSALGTLLQDMQKYKSRRAQDLSQEPATKSGGSPFMPGNGTQDFMAFTNQLETATPAEAEEMASGPIAPVKSEAGSGRTNKSQSFSDFYSSFQLQPTATMASAPAAAQESGDAVATLAANNPKEETNRFKIILKSLEDSNQSASEPQINADVTKDQIQLATDLDLVFPVKENQKEKKSPVKMLASADTRAFSGMDVYPENSYALNTTNREPKSSPELTSKETPAEATVPAAPAENQATESKAQTEPSTSNDEVKIAKAPAETELDTPQSSGHKQIAEKAEARILRRGSSLIPISIETRDIKDRLYADLPITFQVEMKPRNFLPGFILESYKDSPLTKTVNTNAEGVASINLLLHLGEHKINISREIVTTKENTLCKVLITPKI
jgi:hypothetical protein